MRKRRRIWLIVPMWLWFAGDVVLTLSGQSQEYWSGDYSSAIEANPVAYQILVRGPWIFAGLAVAWAILVGAIAIRCTHPLVAWLAVGAAVLHAIGGCSWLARIIHSE